MLTSPNCQFRVPGFSKDAYASVKRYGLTVEGDDCLSVAGPDLYRAVISLEVNHDRGNDAQTDRDQRHRSVSRIADERQPATNGVEHRN